MLASPSSAIDLPLKILVAQGEHGTVRVSYNSVGYLQARHGIPDEFLNPLNGVADLVAAFCRHGLYAGTFVRAIILHRDGRTIDHHGRVRKEAIGTKFL